VTLPLARSELTEADAHSVLAQLTRDPFEDAALVMRWEAAWAGLWQRSAIAFAHPEALLRCLADVLAWPEGRPVIGDPLMDPRWAEAWRAQCRPVVWRDRDPVSGTPQLLPGYPSPSVDHPCAVFEHALFGWPRPVTWGMAQSVQKNGIPGSSWPSCEGCATPVPLVIEDVSATPWPCPGCGHGDIQVACLDANRLVCAGESCVLLSRDADLVERLRVVRRASPAALACALGLSQLGHLVERLGQRHGLASRYDQLLRPRGRFRVPPPEAFSRAGGERYVLHFPDPEERNALAAHLLRVGIGVGSPVWFDPGPLDRMPGTQALLDRILALPLYCSLAAHDQKRIINRIHRWVERG
jgi:hypothetical protein